MSARLLVGLVLLTVVLTPVAIGVPSVVSAVGEITGPDANGDMTLTVRNTGTEPILCFRLRVPDSVKVVNSRDISPEWRLVSSQTTPPTPDIGARSPNGPGIPPGGSVRLVFRTDPAYPVNGGGMLVVTASPNCTPVTPAPVSGPPPPTPPPPPPPPKPKPCTCKDLKTRIVANRSSVMQSTAQGFAMELLIEWNLTCTKGAGNCTGTLDLTPSARGKRLGITITAPAAAVKCAGPCAKTTTRFQKYVVAGGPRWATGKRGRTDRLVRLEMKRTCKSTRIPQTFDIVFNRSGGIDAKLSDLNANGIQDERD